MEHTLQTHGWFMALSKTIVDYLSSQASIALKIYYYSRIGLGYRAVYNNFCAAGWQAALLLVLLNGARLAAGKTSEQLPQVVDNQYIGWHHNQRHQCCKEDTKTQ